jgi:hypothetical protein
LRMKSGRFKVFKHLNDCSRSSGCTTARTVVHKEGDDLIATSYRQGVAHTGHTLVLAGGGRREGGVPAETPIQKFLARRQVP